MKKAVVFFFGILSGVYFLQAVEKTPNLTLPQVEVLRSSDLDSAFLLLDRLWKEGESDNFARISPLKLAYTHGLVAARAHRIRESIEYFLMAHKMDSALLFPAIDAQICAALSESYMFLGDYPSSLSYALEAAKKAELGKDKEYLATSYAIIGNVYNQMNLFDQSHLYIDKAIENTRFIESKLLFQYIKANIYSKQSKFREAARLLSRIADNLENISPKEIAKTYYSNPIEKDFFLAEILMQNAYNLYRIDEKKSAQESCDKALALIRPMDQLRIPIYLSYFNYLEISKNWSTLEKEVNTLLPLISQEDSVLNYNQTLLSFLSKAYANLGEYEKAYSTLLQASMLYEQISQKEKINATIELGTIYETDKKDRQISSQQFEIQNQRSYVIGLIIILGLLGIFLVYVFLHLRTIKQKNKALFDQISRTRQFEGNLQSPQDSHSKRNAIFLALEELMKNEKLFLQPEINRREISIKLSTNETYLQNAIKEACGLTFQNYIYRLRLKEAQEILLNPHNTETVECIALNCGFNSSRNFHRLFKEMYGMTPTEFRKLAREENRSANMEIF